MTDQRENLAAALDDAEAALERVAQEKGVLMYALERLFTVIGEARIDGVLATEVFYRCEEGDEALDGAMDYARAILEKYN